MPLHSVNADYYDYEDAFDICRILQSQSEINLARTHTQWCDGDGRRWPLLNADNFTLYYWSVIMYQIIRIFRNKISIDEGILRHSQLKYVNTFCSAVVITSQLSFVTWIRRVSQWWWISGVEENFTLLKINSGILPRFSISNSSIYLLFFFLTNYHFAFYRICWNE